MRERRPHEIEIEGIPYTVAVRESPRARRLRLSVGPQKPLQVVVPRRTTRAEIDRLLRGNAGWIARETARARQMAERPGALGLDRPGVAWLAGEGLPILAGAGSRPVARLRGGRILVGGEPHQATSALVRWYRREARSRLGAAVGRKAARLGLRPRGLSIGDPRTRWGSCSSRGSLAFSWRLLLAPEDVLDYVVVHELCHLRELNHSAAFWRLLDAARPGWRAQAGWLAEHSLELGAYVPRPAA